MKHRLSKMLAALLCMALLCLTALSLGAWAAEESPGTPSDLLALKIEYNEEEYTLSADDPDSLSAFVEAMDEEEVPLEASYDAATTTFTIDLTEEYGWGFSEPVTLSGVTGQENVVLQSNCSVLCSEALTVENIHDFTAIGCDEDSLFGEEVEITCTGTVQLRSRANWYPVSYGTLSISGAALVQFTGYAGDDVTFTDCGPVTATGSSASAVFKDVTLTNCGDLTVINNSTSGKAVSNLTFTSDAGSSVKLSSASYAVYGKADIDTTGEVSITSASNTVNGSLTINNASDVSIRSTSKSIGGTIALDVPGNVTLSSPGGSSAGNLTITNANDVTVTGSCDTALLPSLNNTVSINCSGALTLRNDRGPLVGTENPPDENLTIQNAASITMEVNSNSLPAVTGNITIENCAGDVSIVNRVGAIAKHKLTIDKAANVTVQGAASGYLFGKYLNSNADVTITCSGDVKLLNSLGGIVYDDLAVTGASALTLSGNCTTPLVWGTLTADGIGAGEVSLTNQRGNLSSSDLRITSNGPVTLSGNDSDALSMGPITIESTSGDVTLENKGISSTSICAKDLTITSGGSVTATGNSGGNGMLVVGKTTITAPGSVNLSNQNGGISSGDFSVTAGNVTATGFYNYYLFSERATIDSTGDVTITNTAGPLVEGVTGAGDLQILNAALVTLTGNSTNNALIHGDAIINSTGDVAITNEAGALLEGENPSDEMVITTTGSVILTGNTSDKLTQNDASFCITSDGFAANNEGNPIRKSFADNIGSGTYVKYHADGDNEAARDFSDIKENIAPDPEPEPEPEPDPDPKPDPEPDPDTPAADNDTISGAVVATVAGGAAIWGGYELTTRVILHKLLPQDAAIPTDRGALALLVWNTAGRPEPAASPTFTDISDADLAQAAQWCVEQGLLDARSETTFAPDTWMPKFRTIQVWRRAFPEQKIF